MVSVLFLYRLIDTVLTPDSDSVVNIVSASQEDIAAVDARRSFVLQVRHCGIFEVKLVLCHHLRFGSECRDIVRCSYCLLIPAND